ncbi:MAG: GNAT family N-acetyltransferase, partial [Anaerolineae bacterium]|nr:GNAT family N-acetyltransferase [Anaerolineae bacterium]
MLDLFNRYAHGFVAIPVILACKKKGFFGLLHDRSALTAAQMVESLGTNSGHFQVALRLMQSLGWLSQAGNGAYAFTVEAEIHRQIPEDMLDLYHLPLEAYLRGETHPGLLGPWLERSRRRWGLDQPWLADFLDGVLVIPLLLSLKQNNLLVDSEQQPLFSTLTPGVKPALTELFVDRGWAQLKETGPSLTDVGQFISERSLILGTTASYTPMLSRMSDVLFGECRTVFHRDGAGDEHHIDRTLNVVASGFQHQKYFADVEAIILSIFNQLPYEAQPKYVADMGCGDGTLLKRVYETIRKSARGQVLAQYPIRMIGVDYNQAALDLTAQTLADIPHLVLPGDIGHPQQLVTDLHAHNIDDPEHILHLRSFLDHNRPFIPPANAAATQGRSPLPYASLHVDADGQLIPPYVAIQSLVEHLERWASIITHHGLLALEVHTLEPEVVRRHRDLCENLHFDAYHAFSQQHLVEADVFLLAAAEAGLFARPGFSRQYPQVLPFSRITLTYFEKRPYTIRYALPTDLPALVELEAACWPEPLRTPVADLQARLEQHPDSQLVLVLERQVVGVVYFQPIADPAALTTTTFEQVAGLRATDGHTIQLLALNVLPAVQHLGLGDQLLEFVLHHCALKSGIETVVGVTRCQGYDNQAALPLAAYIEQRDEQGQRLDPMLKFHEAHGATIQGVVSHYRPEDVANQGYGILIEYDLGRRRRSASDPAYPATTRRQSQAPTKTTIASIVEECVVRIVGQPDRVFDPTRPVREMGLDSLDLMELRSLLSQRLQIKIEPTFFFEYSTPEAMTHYFQQQMSPAEPVRPRSEAAPSLLTPEHTPETSQEMGTERDKAIAIIGLACRFPGGVTSLEDFWTLLQTGSDAITEVPAGRKDLSRARGWSNDPGQRATRYGGFLDGVDHFDATFFHISPREAEVMDPQQRILLEESWHALEQAGIDPTSLRETQTGVFVGIISHDYELLQVKHNRPAQGGAYFGSGNSNSVAAGRIAYALGLQGPAMAVNTACSSSLVAVHLAVQSLKNGECDLALAAGVNLILSPELSRTFAQAGMLAPDGRCKTFAAAANGYVRSEGCGVVVLKRLSEAVADKDNILAVIRGSAINQDGASNGLTAPNGLAQAALLRKAIQAAGIKPHEVSYVEAHGTGTSLGDPVEIKALGTVYGMGRTVDNPLVV